MVCKTLGLISAAATNSNSGIRSIWGKISDAPTPMPTMPSLSFRCEDPAVLADSSTAMPCSFHLLSLYRFRSPDGSTQHSPLRQWSVHRLGILLYHTARAESRHGCSNRFPHHLQPAPRHIILIPVVKGRHDLFFEQLVKRFGVGGINLCRIMARHAPIDHPSVLSRVRLRPPPVFGTQMQRAIDRRFHTARSARLERLARRIQPHIAALDQKVRDVKIVVLQKRDSPPE